MPRRKTTLGRGAFGRAVPADFHAFELFSRHAARNSPLVEDAVGLCLYIWLQNRGSIILQRLRQGRHLAAGGGFYFSPDIDMVEIRSEGTIVGYELKGMKKKQRSYDPPPYYDGLDQALGYLINPVTSPLSVGTPMQSIFDYVYLVHPRYSMPFAPVNPEAFNPVINACTPIGYLQVDYERVEEIVPPKKNPFVSEDVKKLFLKNLESFEKASIHSFSLPR